MVIQKGNNLLFNIKLVDAIIANISLPPYKRNGSVTGKVSPLSPEAKQSGRSIP